MSLSQRKQGELYRKLDSLAREFQHWRDESEKDKKFEKHHTQIRRVTLQLQGLQDATRRQLDDLAREGGRGVLARARAVEDRILEVHRIWEFFRGKFVLRSAPWFSPFLVAADEFAWACYSAAREKYAAADRDRLKEPPLVFFNGGSSPFTQPRQYTFQAEQVAGAPPMTEESGAVLQELPIPVIGVPWFQIQHLPEALVIGHEVGHDVEHDFGLEARLRALLEAGMEGGGVPAERRPAWLSWLRETFADLYGVLATGPAFVGSLIDFLATDAAQTAAAVRRAPRWGSYPPDYLRVLVNLCALDLLGFKQEGAELRSQLDAAYGRTHAMAEFEPDIEPVVKAILDGPYAEFGGLKLTDVLCFDSGAQHQAVEDGKSLLDGFASSAYDMFTLFAAARLAYGSNAQLYESKEVHRKVLDKVPELRKAGVRAKPAGEESLNEEQKRERQEALDRHDLAAGAGLLDKLAAGRKARRRRRG